MSMLMLENGTEKMDEKPKLLLEILTSTHLSPNLFLYLLLLLWIFWPNAGDFLK